MNRIKIAFFGYGENGASCLQSLLREKARILYVVISDKETSQKIKTLANKNRIPLLIFSKSNISEIIKKISKPNFDIFIVSSFPYLLSKKIYSLPRYGTLNIHAGALPRYRGYHPLNWAIIRGEETIGVTIHYIDEGIDSGNIIAQETMPLTVHDDINSIKKRAIKIGERLLVKTVREIEKKKKRLIGIKQDDKKATFAPKRSWSEGRIDWNSPARNIFNLVRALKNPYPNAFSYYKKEKIDFEDVYIPKKAGKILAKFGKRYLITTGDGVILLQSKQKLRKNEILH